MTTARKTVILTHPRTRQVVIVRPGETVPEWAEVTNPAVTGRRSPGGRAPQPNPETVTQPAAETGRPSHAGRGSSRDAWVAYAESIGVNVPSDLSRDEIIDLVGSVEDG